MIFIHQLHLIVARSDECQVTLTNYGRAQQFEVLSIKSDVNVETLDATICGTVLSVVARTNVNFEGTSDWLLSCLPETCLLPVDCS